MFDVPRRVALPATDRHPLSGGSGPAWGGTEWKDGNVPDMPSTTNGDLAERLRRWLVMGGYIVGGWAILQSILMIAAWGQLPFNRYFRWPVLTQAHRLGTTCYLIAPLLLVSGCWGFQRHRHWSRPLLLTYAGTWTGGLFVVEAVQFAEALSQSPGEVNGRQLFALALGNFDLFVYASVYAVGLVLCLTRPEIRDHFPEFHTGFSPIIAEGSSGS